MASGGIPDSMKSFDPLNCSSITDKSLPDAPKHYEEMLIKLEGDIRMHIRIEQQLKLHIESV